MEKPKQKNKLTTWHLSGSIISGFILSVALAMVLSTVFYMDHTLWEGVIISKYFWFAGSMCIAVLLYLIYFISDFRRERYFRRTDAWFACFVLYILFNFLVLNPYPGMHGWLFLLMIPLYVMVRELCADDCARRRILALLLVAVSVEAIWGLLQLYGFAWSNHTLFKVTGSLFNPGPYSGFVAVGVPLALSHSLNRSLSKWERYLGGITLLAALLILPAAMSRAAWLAAGAGCVPVLWKYASSKVFAFEKHTEKESGSYFFRHFIPLFRKRSFRVVGVMLACILAIVFLSGIYLMKKDSADGRWLIWQVSVGMVKEHPLTGTGFGSFNAVYGDAQAGFFLAGKGTDAQMMVADIPGYAFNEYVQIAVELGLAGLFLFLMMTASAIFTGKRRNTPQQDDPLTGGIRSSLLAFLVFAAFSYPFGVLPLSIMFIFLLALTSQASPPVFSLPVWLKGILPAVCLIFTVYAAFHILPKRDAYLKWTSLQSYYKAGIYTQAITDYTALYESLKYEKQFLFEYGQSLSKTGQYTESNRIFHQFLHYGNDPMVYNCMGNNYKSMEEYEVAEKMYIRASQMVPNRHYPVYLLMKLYDETGQKEKARQTATVLLDKPVKVPSTAIREMQQEAKEIIENEK